jgi:hypothetical protein
MSTESIFKIWLRDPQLALEEFFRREKKRVDRRGLNGDVIRIRVRYQCVDGVWHSRIQDVTKHMLKGRRYEIECPDYQLAIALADVVYDRKTNTSVPGIPPFWFEPPLDRQQMAHSNWDGVL